MIYGSIVRILRRFELGVRFDWLKYNIRKFSIEKRNKEHNKIKELKYVDEKICEGVACPVELN